MDIRGFWKWHKPSIGLKQEKVLCSIHSAERFRAILEREKARAERNCHTFSLLLFEVSKSGGDNSQEHYLVHSLVNRIRLTDEVGWFDQERIGVILPCSSAANTRRLADGVCQAIGTKVSAPKYTVYTYPSDSSCQGNGHCNQLYFKDIFPKSEAGTKEGFSMSSRGDEHRDILFSSKWLTSDTTSNCRMSPQGQEPFFLQSTRIWKRAFDIVGSIIALIILSPLFVFVSLLIKAVSVGPVFFKQQRVGYKGRAFTMLKFRTMKVNANAVEHKQYVTKLINSAAQNGTDADKPMTKLNNHWEWIRFGRILRRTCIDELPQLINVLGGEMSLIGPRPALAYEVEQYLPWHYRRFDILPGMTGLWQVSGKNRLSFNEMVRLDIRYAKQQSIWLDIKILLRTPFAIISQFVEDLQEGQVMDLRGMEKCLTLR